MIPAIPPLICNLGTLNTKLGVSGLPELSIKLIIERTSHDPSVFTTSMLHSKTVCMLISA